MVRRLGGDVGVLGDVGSGGESTSVVVISCKNLETESFLFCSKYSVVSCIGRVIGCICDSGTGSGTSVDSGCGVLSESVSVSTLGIAPSSWS